MIEISIQVIIDSDEKVNIEKGVRELILQLSREIKLSDKEVALIKTSFIAGKCENFTITFNKKEDRGIKILLDYLPKLKISLTKGKIQ